MSNAARGSDDDYCSAYPPEPHHNISHSVDANPIHWVEICQLCGHVSNKALRLQIAEAASRSAQSSPTVDR